MHQTAFTAPFSTMSAWSLKDFPDEKLCDINEGHEMKMSSGRAISN
jgi:hypothetical protein